MDIPFTIFFRENSELKSRSHSPSSSQSSKPKSTSPIRYQSSRIEHEHHSPRDRRSYWSRRHSGYHYSRGYGDLRDHFRSSYRRDTDRSRGRRYSYYRRSRSTSRSRKRSESRSRSLKYHNAELHSPRHRHVRSPSSDSDHSAARGASNRHITLKNPIVRSSISSSPRKPTSRSLSPLGKSQSYSSSSLSVKDRKVRHHRSSIEKTNASDVDYGWQEREGTPPRKEFIKNNRSNPSLSSGSTSIDHSIRKTQLEPIGKSVVTSKLAFANDHHSSSTSLDHRTRLPDSRLSGNEDFDNMHVGTGLKEAGGLKLHGSIVEERRNDQFQKKVNCCSPLKNIYSDPESLKLNDTLEHKAQSKAVSQYEEKSPISPDAETENGRMKAKMDSEKCSQGAITTEIPIVYQYPQEKSRRKSRSRERKRKDRRHHKRRGRDQNDDDDEGDHKKESHSDRKLRRHGKKYHHRRRHKNQKENKKKRKHREMSSSSLEDSSPSFDNKYKRRHVCSSKKSTRLKKKETFPII